MQVNRTDRENVRCSTLGRLHSADRLPKFTFHPPVQGSFMTTTRKAATPTARRRSAAAPTPPRTVPAPAATNLDAARQLFNASLAPMHGVLRLMAQWRETQAGLLHEMDQALGATLREAESAADVGGLLRLQGELASGNLNRATNAAGALWRSWLETEAALLEQAQRRTADLTRQIMREAQSNPAGSNLPDPNAASALLKQAQAAWTQAARQWLTTARQGGAR